MFEYQISQQYTLYHSMLYRSVLNIRKEYELRKEKPVWLLILRIIIRIKETNTDKILDQK